MSPEQKRSREKLIGELWLVECRLRQLSTFARTAIPDDEATARAVSKLGRDVAALGAVMVGPLTEQRERELAACAPPHPRSPCPRRRPLRPL